MRKIFDKRILKIRQKYVEQGIQVEIDANFFGIESYGLKQIRGNGILLLTDTSLVFGMFMPSREFVFPLSKIERVDLVKSHLSKSVSKPLLKVWFTNDEGQHDSVAWWIQNPEDFKALLDSKLEM